MRYHVLVGSCALSFLTVLHYGLMAFAEAPNARTDESGAPDGGSPGQGAGEPQQPSPRSATNEGTTPPGEAPSAPPGPASGAPEGPVPSVPDSPAVANTQRPSPDDAAKGPGDTAMSVRASNIVVSGRRSRLRDLPGSVDVIGENQTSKEVTTNALDLLRRIPGFAYQDYGNGGVPNGFMLRGFSSNHGNDTLVVIDGVPINDHSWYGQDDGAPDLNQLTSEEIERIDVIKGPLDARYGNWGRSGIVEIRTRQSGSFWRGNATLGSFGTKKAYASFGTEYDEGRFNQVYSIESFQTDGWRQNSAQQRQNAYGKWFYRPATDVRLGLLAHVYRADWGTGSYIDEAQWQQNPQQAFPGSSNDGGYKEVAEVAVHVDAKLLRRFPVKVILWDRFSKASRYADWTYEGHGQTDDHATVRVLGGIANIETDWEIVPRHRLRLDAGVDYRHFRTVGSNWTTVARVRQNLNTYDEYIFQNGGVYLKAGYDLVKQVRLSAGIREDSVLG